MISLEIFYRLKPLFPRRLQLGVRRFIANQKRISHFDIWPINPEASVPPKEWPGWPGGKQFALVLTHDVDTKRGSDKALKLMELEEKLGFRSSFNFVPEGYPVLKDTLKLFRSRGFGVGVHGLTHDGLTFINRKRFIRAVPKINSYLREWGATGFHSPSVLASLSTISYLNVEYDCSSFDTDPFEPINESVKTIFPFILFTREGDPPCIEFPYTLPQDHCLFVILKEKDIRIWKRKADWIARNGGMILLNTHPDYMNFEDNPLSGEEYPIRLYIEFLDYINSEYADKYWHTTLPELARHWQERVPKSSIYGVDVFSAKSRRPFLGKRKTIWIDLDNSPHVLFFSPIIKELEKRDYRLLITARDNSQTCELADKFSINYLQIGKHYGRNKILKIIMTIFRAIKLSLIMKKYKIELAISHGSRSQILASKMLRISSLGILDYEFIADLGGSSWLLGPEILMKSSFSDVAKKCLSYPGIKEDVYLPFFKPNLKLREYLLVGAEEILVTIRPPASEAHYHNPESDVLFDASINWLKDMEGVRVVILPRYESQQNYVENKWPDEIKSRKIIILTEAVDGLSLLWNSDLVISGGGTMNREAASLRIPVYSIFKGRIGVVDKWLNEQGRLELIETAEDFHQKIRVEKREIKHLLKYPSNVAIHKILEHIERIAEEANR